ncbi:MAG TPA: TetR/AcrR family transcriptional regulator [Candidatus Eisenbacteria bacterium]|jgi:AcrR family transcriptional regulator|nr:TetR/AcrR family transcriptional regulator [Candidatus Eisenbacteria bacterium]
MMPKTKADSRTRLLQAAEKTTYLYGFGSTSIADIAKLARVPLGNVYYYFKSKDEIGGAIVELRVSRFKKLLRDLDKADSPKERLCRFVDIKIKNREALARGGCPAGTLCSELQKYGGSAARKSRVLFAEALAWMEKQFEALGKGTHSRGLAVHLLSATQGVSLLAHTFHDAALIEMEAQQLKEWIRTL